ncbi:hypothetical protein SUGI_0143120 [Cryptomeria japonica]|uniref:uncharacterized protein LOC131075364 n=1 Tax=Cryptomeria japonica TaxID=3369 RepID=UPI002408EC87|nr:uncharacterized protein LOC131075364 [Cryptomeria japonica]GLJ11106.1 hypothetical protein SUGI_0143120 [Cryptomeria japonica]
MSLRYEQDVIAEHRGPIYRARKRLARKMKDIYRKDGQEIWNRIMADKPMWPFLIPVLLFAWILERWLVPFSNWVPLFVTVWATIQYGRYQRQILVEQLNNKWKRHILNTLPTTPLEPCEWFNKLLMAVWPNFIEPKLSDRFVKIMLKRLRERKPRPIQSIELQEFSLGLAPPILGLQRTYWSITGNQPIMHMGFEWDTNEMSVLLAAKLAKPLRGMARIVINSIHLKGDLRFMPILDGQALLYSFESIPEVRIGVAFGSGSQTIPATELPGVSPWLEKVFIETLTRTMVEPRRKCLSLPAVNLKKRAVGGILSVTVVSASNIFKLNTKGAIPDRRVNSHGSSYSNGSVSSSGSSSGRNMNTFVEVELGHLTRRTASCSGSTPRWDETFNVVLHENMGTLKMNLYEQCSGHVKYDFLAGCEIKVKYVDDDSTTFWAIGRDSSVCAARAEHCGKEVTMVVPFEGVDSSEITVKLVLREWQYADDLRNLHSRSQVNSQQPTLGSWSTHQPPTGRNLKVTVVEGRNLTGKDRSGKSDPYIKLQYGKIIQKTKSISRELNPVWNQEFEFNEIGDGEYLKVKCYNEEFLGDESMGSARVNLEGLEEGARKDVWVPLEKVPTGEVRLKIEVQKTDQDTDGYQTSSTDTGNGWIELVLIEAKDLVAADWRGSSDPYVRVQYGSMKKRTKVMYKTLNPQWNQTLEFPDTGSPLVLHVRDHNAVLPTSNIGDCKVEYERLPPNQTVDKWIPLQGVKKGEIRVQVTRRMPEKLKKTGSSPSSSGITPVHKLSGKVRAIIKKVKSLAEDGDPEKICLTLDELESVEEEQEAYMLQLQREKKLLLSKIDELDQVMNGFK